MQVQDLSLLYDYNYWARDRILMTTAQVSEEQYIGSAPDSWNRLRGNLVHTLDAEYGWRMLCQDKRPIPLLTEDELPTLAALQARWRDEEAAMRAYLASLTDADLTGSVRYMGDEPRERVLWHCLFHMLNHSGQHRSEAAALLTAYGHSPGDLDFTIFLNEQKAHG